MWRGATRRGGSPESHPVPHSSKPALGLCDLELEEAGLGHGSERPVSPLPPGGLASECTLKSISEVVVVRGWRGWGPGFPFLTAGLHPVLGLAFEGEGQLSFYSVNGLLSCSHSERL